MSIRTCPILLVALFLGSPGLARGEDFYDETVLRTLYLEFSQPTWWAQLTANYESETNLEATLTVDGQDYEGVGVRFRGSTSYRTVDSLKKSFNIEIDHTNEDLRLMGYRTLNLINCNEDPTFMREVLYTNACRRQFPNAKGNFVKLVINDENWGVYANIQQLNTDFIEEWFASNDGTRWRGLGQMGGGVPGGVPGGGPGGVPGGGPGGVPGGGPGGVPGGGGPGAGGQTDGRSALTWLGADPCDYAEVYELKGTKQDDPWTALLHTCDLLNNTNLDALPDVLEDVLDVDRALWLCAFEIIFHDDDGYVSKRGSDYALYYEPETGRIYMVQYDGNSCMRESGRNGWDIFYREDDPLVPIMNRLMQIPVYRQRYLAHARTILECYMNEDYLWPRIEAYRDLIAEEVSRDTKKIYSTPEFNTGITTLKNFIRDRRAFTVADESGRELLVPPQILSVEQEVIQEADGQALAVTVTFDPSVPVAKMECYLAEGMYARFYPYAMEASGPDLYQVVLGAFEPGTFLRYYVAATTDNSAGTMAFDPPGAEHEVYTYAVTYARVSSAPIAINELMAANDTSLADPQGDYDDWIELLNVSSQTVDLSGMHLSDNPENPLKWQVPDGVTLAPGEYLIIWADEDGRDEPGLHANFKLASAGETLWLYDSDTNGNRLLDTVTFPALAADHSYGRLPDGSDQLVVLDNPSPLAANE